MTCYTHNGQEAVDVFKGRTIALILMDMEMPVMDGYQATKAIRKLENGYPHKNLRKENII